MMVTLTDLPAELIQQIHLYALNPFLPQTSVYVHSVLHDPPTSYAAQYLLSLYSAYGPNEILVRALRHPICGVDVVKEINEVWDLRRGYDPSTKRRAAKVAHSSGSPGQSRSPSRFRSRSRSASRSPTPPPPPTVPALTCSELPRRLFRDLSSPSSSPLTTAPTASPISTSRHAAINPLLMYLFERYSPSPNSHKGYPLCRAVLMSNYVLVQYLLSQGADPELKDCLALEIAISMKDIRMVKLLVEPDTYCHQGQASEGSPLKTLEKSFAGSSSPTITKKGKKMKLNDRITIGPKLVESAMKKGSKEIVNYFVYEKKVMPPLQSIMKLGRPDPTIIPPKMHRSSKISNKSAGKPGKRRRSQAF